MSLNNPHAATAAGRSNGTPNGVPLRDALQARIDQGLLPGAVLLVQQADGQCVCEALGMQQVAVAGDAGVPMARDSIFRIYSMTKPIVSLATMMLVEQGRMLLSQPVARWLPTFAQQRVRVPGAGGAGATLEPVQRPATVHDLLRHTAGLSYGWGDDAVSQAYRDARIGSRGRSNAELAAAIGGLPLAHQPGSTWEYSRATDVLGAVLEAVVDAPLRDVLQDMVLGPLGMRDTAFHVPPAQQHRLAQPFATDPATGSATALIDVRSPAPFESGGGGLVSTAQDYARFLSLLIGGGSVDGVRLVGRATLRWMAADHLAAGVPAVGGILADGYGFGLGFAVRRQDGLAARAGAAGQVSWSGMAGTAFFVDPAYETFALVLTQAPSQLDDLCALLPNLVLGAL